MSGRSIACFCLVLIAPAATVVAQDLYRVKTLYVAAAYEEALAAIPADVSGAASTDLEQYRALCLLALGREAEAVAAIERLVRTDPGFLPPEAETSPRMRAMFADVRSKLVPAIAKATYVEARAAFSAQDTAAARAKFQRTVELIDSLPESERTELADLRVLVTGFLDLADARVPGKALAPLVERPAAQPTAPLPSEYVAPVPIREELPAWAPPDSAAMQTEYVGLLQIAIDEDGRVSSARMLKSTHPVYDAAIMRASKSWTYKPATRAGRPVASLKNIQVRLIPR